MEILTLAFQDNLNPKKVSSTNGGEYHSPCPACKGKDRFIIWNTKNRYYCRRCEKTGDTIQYLRDFHALSFKEACSKANVIPKPNRVTTIKKFNRFIPVKPKSLNFQWRAKALDFVLRCHQNLLNTSEALGLLQKRGFSLDSIKKFQLGWNEETSWANWLEGTTNKKIWLPRGIVIPSFIEESLNKVKIRRSDWNINDKFPKYVEIHGSSSGASVYGSNYDLPIIILESELDAMLVQQEAEHLCFAIALGGATKKPNTYINSLLIKSPLTLFSLDYDEAGIKAYKWWENRYKNLFIWFPHIEKSIGDAFQKGLSIKKWISQGIEEHLIQSSFNN